MDEGCLNVEENYKVILEEIKECNVIKYAAYRTASKLCVLQKYLKFESVSLRLIKGILEQHHIYTTDNSILLKKEEVVAVVHDIYFVISKETAKTIDVECLLHMFVHFLQHVYDKHYDEAITVLNLKVALVVLSGSPLERKYQYWFSELADHNLCLSRRHLQSLLQSLLAITNYLSESNTFCHNLLQPTLDSCFLQNSLIGINEVDFMNWILREPQLLVWLSTFYRLSAAKKVVHEVRCAVCHTSPIIGLRYRCLRCVCYDLCQLCFFTARTSKRHKSSHMIREYCYQTTSFKTAVAYLKGILNRLCGNSSRLQYLPAQDHSASRKLSNDDTDENPLIREESHLEDIILDHNVQSSDESQINPTHQLQVIISQIESETRFLKKAVGCDSDGKLISQHAHFLQEQLDRLRALKNELDGQKRACIVSTPMNGHKVCNDFELSSIIVRSDETWSPSSPSGFSTWLHSSNVETSQTRQLQTDLDQILSKLHCMLETNFSICDK